MDTSQLLVGAVSALSLAAIYFNFRAFTYWSSRGIKGPTPWPLLGTNIYYMLYNRCDVDTWWREKYGHVYGIYNGYTPHLRISDTELIKFVYIKNFRSFTTRDNTFIYGDNMKRWLFWTPGDHWTNQRALMTPMFTSSRMKTMFKTMSECSSLFLKEISSRLDGGQHSTVAKKNLEENGCFSKDELMALTLDVIARAFFGLKMNTYRDKTSEFFKKAYAFAAFDVPHFIFWLFVPAFLAKPLKVDLVTYDKYEYFDTLSQTAIKERRKNPTVSHNDFLQMLMEAKIPDDPAEKVRHSQQDDMEAHYNDNTTHQELDSIYDKQLEKVSFRKFDDLEIRAQMTFFFLAGFETTSSSLSICLFQLAHEQSAQQEVYEELKQVEDLLTEDGYSTLMSLKKLDAFISESLRLYTPVSEHNRIVTAEEGVVLPTNPPLKLDHKTVLSVPGFVLQRDSDYWKDALKFDMTRFYPENRANIKSCSYMPFGLGPRNCLGMRFALLNIKSVLARLLLKYQVHPSATTRDNPPKLNRHSFFVQLTHTDFVLKPREN